MILTGLHRVDVSTWLAAMPAIVVTPAARKAAVDKMLADIPQPPDFDVSALTGSPLLLDRYQLGARVAKAVSCAWLDRWTHGDPLQRAQASVAMGTSRHWAILRQMRSQGDYPFNVWLVADAMNGIPIRGMVPGQTVAEVAKADLGC